MTNYELAAVIAFVSKYIGHETTLQKAERLYADFITFDPDALQAFMERVKARAETKGIVTP